MIDIGIYEGDALLIDRSIEPRHGNIVLAVLNNDFTVKRLHRRGGVIKLVPENPRYQTIVVKEEEEFSIFFGGGWLIRAEIGAGNGRCLLQGLH